MSKQITLRPLTENDVDAFMKWGSDPEVTQSLFWDHYTSREQAYETLKKITSKHPWYKAICLEGTPIGAITLDRGTGRAEKRAELGYVLAKEYWGQGYATQAVILALECGFEELNILRIEAFVDPENRGSSRVLEKAGMTKEAHLKNYLIHRGQIKDRYIYASTKAPQKF